MIENIKNNKKYIIICTLFFCFCVGITLALSSSVGNSLTNSFTLGSVDTEIDEPDPTVDDSHIDKAPYVKNIGTNSALVRMRVTISPTELKEKYGINLEINDDKYVYNENEDSWKNTDNYWILRDDGYYYYTGVIDSLEQTEPLFTKVTGNKIIDDNGGIIKELEGLEIAVYYDSIQNVARADDGTEIIANTGNILNDQNAKDLWEIFDSQN